VGIKYGRRDFEEEGNPILWKGWRSKGRGIFKKTETGGEKVTLFRNGGVRAVTSLGGDESSFVRGIFVIRGKGESGKGKPFNPGTSSCGEKKGSGKGEAGG